MPKTIAITTLCCFLLLASSCQQPQQAQDQILKETEQPVDIFFCPHQNCEAALVEQIEEARSQIHCAFFDIDLEILIRALERKSKEIETKMIIDANNNHNQLKNLNYKEDDNSQLMHNKFCIIDNKIVATGSFNPTENGNTKNNNNLLIIHSKQLARNFGDEFQELWNERFGEGDKTKIPTIIHNGKAVENYFCPEDQCSEQLIAAILNAKQSIYFMTFSFTDQRVADAILMSKAPDIRGVFEKFQAGGRYSQYQRLKDFGLSISLDNNSRMMHHKVFIIDNQTVITGSYNPTSAGTRKNDENMLIIHNKRIAKEFLNEFERVSSR